VKKQTDKARTELNLKTLVYSFALVFVIGIVVVIDVQRTSNQSPLIPPRDRFRVRQQTLSARKDQSWRCIDGPRVFSKTGASNYRYEDTVYLSARELANTVLPR
jgi:hypothetical protein